MNYNSRLYNQFKKSLRPDQILHYNETSLNLQKDWYISWLELYYPQPEEPTKTTFFLFGSAATDMYKDEGINAVIKADNESYFHYCETFKYVEGETHIVDILDASITFDDYCEITEEEYNLMNQQTK